MKMKKYGGGYKLFAVIIIILLMTIAVSVVKFREGEIDYYNSDATWHMMFWLKTIKTGSLIQLKEL